MRMFSSRSCRTTLASISRLETIAFTRFGKNIRTLHIDFYLVYGQSNAHVYTSSQPSILNRSYLEEEGNPRWLLSKLASIFQRTMHLKYLSICAHPDTSEFSKLEMDAFWTFGAIPFLTAMLTTRRNTVLELFPALHSNSLSLSAPCIMEALRHSNLQLKTFGMVGFTKSLWQSHVITTLSSLADLAIAPSVHNLTNLDLQLDILNDDCHIAMIRVVKIIENNSSLKCFKLCAGPLDMDFRVFDDCCTPLLDCLGLDPPFRLQTLEIDGLITSSHDTTLDHIVRTHNSSLRRLVLDHLHFYAPNSLRSFFSHLAKSDTEYFAIRNCWIHYRAWLCRSTLRIFIRPDEVTDWNFKDSSDQSWIEIDWVGMNQSEWIIYDMLDGKISRRVMRDSLMCVVEQVDCGGIRDY